MEKKRSGEAEKGRRGEGEKERRGEAEKQSKLRSREEVCRKEEKQRRGMQRRG